MAGPLSEASGMETRTLTLVFTQKHFASADLHSLFAIYSSFSLGQHNVCLIKYKHIIHKHIKTQENNEVKECPS